MEPVGSIRNKDGGTVTAGTMGKPAGIDQHRVTNWLMDVVGAVPPVRFETIGAGKSNLTYRVSDDTGSVWVLRRPPLGELAPSAHNVAREYSIQARLAASAVPVPKMLGLATDPDICDAPLVLMEHVEGAVLDNEAAVAAVPEAIRRSAGLSLASTLALVHEVDLVETELADLSSVAPYAPRQIKRWLRQWETTKTHDAPLVDELAARLLQKAPQQHEVTLVHGDYHLMNVILDPGSGQVRAILDWELSTLGDPLADLGSLLSYWPDNDDHPIFTQLSLNLAPGFPSRAELIRAYADASGRDISNLGFWHALGYWKVAIIMEGIRRRCLDEPRNGEPAEIAEIDGLLERARQTASEAGL